MVLLVEDLDDPLDDGIIVIIGNVLDSFDGGYHHADQRSDSVS